MRLGLVLLVVAEVLYDLARLVAALVVHVQLVLELREDVLQLLLSESRLFLLADLLSPNAEGMLVVQVVVNVTQDVLLVAEQWECLVDRDLLPLHLGVLG